MLHDQCSLIYEQMMNRFFWTESKTFSAVSVV